MVIMSLALALHVLAAVVWVGGMFFAYVCLRPVLVECEPAERLQIWVRTFGKFFPWVTMAIAILFLTGFYMLFAMGGFGHVGNHIIVMLVIAVLMSGIFKFVYVAPFRHLKQNVDSGNQKVAAHALGTIRKLVATNLALGLIVIIVATAGKVLF